jgi:hypothetical protein
LNDLTPSDDGGEEKKGYSPEMMFCFGMVFILLVIPLIALMVYFWTVINPFPVLYGSTNITTPPFDPRSYKLLIMKNGMPIMLISDPTTKKSGAAFNVMAGSLDNPDYL